MNGVRPLKEKPYKPQVGDIVADATNRRYKVHAVGLRYLVCTALDTGEGYHIPVQTVFKVLEENAH